LTSPRVLKLPELNELTPEQQRINNLPLNGRFLVVGAPGTGKSVVALNRLREYSELDDVTVITFNHVLKSYTTQLAEKSTVYSAIGWLYKMQYGLTGKLMPEQAPAENSKRGSDYRPNYSVLNDIFSQYSQTLENNTIYFKDNPKPWRNLPDPALLPEKEYQHVIKQAECAQILRHTDLIIDEGQDLPEGYYKSLMYLGFKNFFIVADQNQQITEENSNREDLETVVGEEVYELTENFRNTTPIAIICQHFHTDRASPLPNLPDRPSAIKPMLINYSMVDKAIERILREADRDDSKLIGVIVGSETKREDYIRKLQQIDVTRDNPKPMISTYSSSSNISKRVNIDFSQGGIVVLADKSVKGIEFDTVFIFLDGIKLFDEILIMKRLYVMSSRAKEKLFYLQSKMYPSEVSKLLPTDTQIMQRIED